MTDRNFSTGIHTDNDSLKRMPDTQIAAPQPLAQALLSAGGGIASGNRRARSNGLHLSAWPCKPSA
jgi:hypothetical protein